MGWKASTIIIYQPTPIEHKALLEELGCSNLTKIEDQPFEKALYPTDKEVYIGTYKDNLLVCVPDIPLQFFDDQASPVEKTLHRIFPNAEICAIMLQSTVNLWGYAITIKGQKRRIRAGSADNGTFVETGEPVEEEKELLSQSSIDEHREVLSISPVLPSGNYTLTVSGDGFTKSIKIFKK